MWDILKISINICMAGWEAENHTAERNTFSPGDRVQAQGLQQRECTDDSGEGCQAQSASDLCIQHPWSHQTLRMTVISTRHFHNQILDPPPVPQTFSPRLPYLGITTPQAAHSSLRICAGGRGVPHCWDVEQHPWLLPTRCPEHFLPQL